MGGSRIAMRLGTFMNPCKRVLDRKPAQGRSDHHADRCFTVTGTDTLSCMALGKSTNLLRRGKASGLHQVSGLHTRGEGSHSWVDLVKPSLFPHFALGRLHELNPPSLQRDSKTTPFLAPRPCPVPATQPAGATSSRCESRAFEA